jgi:hypothetical protein
MPAESTIAVLVQGRSLLVLISLVCALGLATPGQAQSPGQTSTREFRASRAVRPPLIDGQLSEEAWSQAQVMSDFIQIDPDEGQPASERTEVRVLYDDRALYVGVRLFDREAAQIGRRLSTRDDDDSDADRITLYLDPMHDHLTGVMFRVNAANVQTDAVLFNDTWDDWSWNAVWNSEVSIDEGGWSVEMRIPLSQLRFTSDDTQVWGINLERYIRRRNEESWLEMVPKKETGRASRMVHLVGMNGLEPSRRLELLPYTAGRAEYVAPSSPLNPFNDGSRVFASAGSRCEVWTDQQSHDRCHGEPGLRSGRSRPRGGESERVRDVLCGEARVLPRGCADLQQLRPRRLDRQLGLQQFRATDLLLAAYRAIAAAAARRGVRRSANRHDDLRRGEAHRQDRRRMEHWPARGRHEQREGADADGVRPR